MAILVLFSSSFVLIDQHYCEGKLHDSSFFGKANVCDMHMASCSSEKDESSVDPKSCCSNKSEIKTGSVFIKIPVFNINNLEHSIVSNINLFKQIKYSNFTNHKSPIIDYYVPLITRDVLILIQCFRI